MEERTHHQSSRNESIPGEPDADAESQAAALSDAILHDDCHKSRSVTPKKPTDASQCSEVQETVDALPRLRSESQALHKQIHPQYEDITIRSEAELCDPALPEENEDNDDDDVDEQIEEIYDEDDLMEIDRFESIALGDLENDIEGSQQNADKVAHNDKPEEQRNDAEQEAEMRWPEVIEAIKSQQGQEVNFEELDWAAKTDILRSNPVTPMRMFDKRVEALLIDLLLSSAQPLGRIVDWFYRLEFQHRGSPHIHCLIWLSYLTHIRNLNYTKLSKKCKCTAKITQTVVSKLLAQVADISFPDHLPEKPS
ncbi:hypothetical protein Q8A73_003930 [Channa argus]|nr:hypothetical protein Q8A73_003930 [Channa argus]